MKIFIKIAIRVLPVLLVLGLLYIGYLNFYGDRAQYGWFGGGKKQYDVEKASKEANNYFDRYFDQLLSMDPERQSRLGIKTQQGQWTPLSEAALQKRHSFDEQTLQYLNDSIVFQSLDSNTQISYLLLKKNLNYRIEGYKFRHHEYLVNQMHGLHAEIPAFLMNVHQIADEEDALAYLSRLQAIQPQFDTLIMRLEKSEAIGARLPGFLIPKIIESCQNIISGRPYKAMALQKNILFEDFSNKLDPLEDIEKSRKKELVDSCKQLLLSSVQPAYQKLISYLQKTEQVADNKAGCWKMENGEAYYAHKLKVMTTKNLSPETIFQLGNEEVERIHNEMKTILKKVNFQGDLQAFFEFMRKDRQFYYPNNKAGHAAYVKRANEIIDSMRPRLPQLFHSLPKAKLVVKPVEAYREKSAGKAFYQPPAADGSRPGIYYVNTYDMDMVPKYQMEALAYHEAIPGHHMQLAIAQELEELPRFRRYGHNYYAYIEGWGLYSEYIPKEMGFYKDPYSDFGRLAMELWRACRLVVDVGIHHKHWNRKQAIQFYKDNTPNSELDVIKMVERHMVMPAQATTYKIGMISLLELRDKAKRKLGDAFDVRDFHDVVLKHGALPLDVLEDLVDVYIEARR